MSAPTIASNIASSSRRQIVGSSHSLRRLPIVQAAREISSSSSFRSELTPLPTESSPTLDPISPKQRYQLLNFPPLKPLSRPYGYHVASLHLAAHHPYPLDLYTTFSLHAAHSLGIPTSNPASLPTTTALWTVIKSPFVHKKSQENFGRKTHRRLIKVWDTDKSVVDLWLRYLKKNGIGGVGMRADVYEWVEPGQVQRELKDLEGRMGQLGEEEMRLKADELERELSVQAEAQEQ